LIERYFEYRYLNDCRTSSIVIDITMIIDRITYCA
jgi:hypothetical protein